MINNDSRKKCKVSRFFDSDSDNDIFTVWFPTESVLVLGPSLSYRKPTSPKTYDAIL